MKTVLQSQLQIERKRYAKLKQEGRSDYIAMLVLERAQQDINKLERRINGETNRHKSAKPRRASGIIRYVFQTLHRLRNYKEGWNYSIFRVPAKAILQTQAGTQ